jgi:glycosyltransferase involved in cell wall biosynthesis
MYKVDEHWGGDEELLEGYRFKFLKNYAPRPSYLKWPFGLFNIGIIREVILGRPDAVILMSWMNPTWWMALTACALFRIPFFYMTDANFQIERFRSKRKRRIKELVLGKVLFKLCSGFLCAGEANRSFYRLYGVPENKLYTFAYSWGYDQLLKISQELKPQRSRIRGELAIPKNSLVFLYCGRLSSEKNLFCLVEAYHQLDDERKTLIFVGDGDLREALQKHVDELGAGPVIFFGFQNRDQIAKYYAISDLLILPSLRETWGIVVNEAMCFGLPAIVSHQVGAGIDLIADGQNGYSVATDVDSLFSSIKRFTKLSEEERSLMGMRSLNTMKEWVRRDLAESLVNIIESARAR